NQQRIIERRVRTAFADPDFATAPETARMRAQQGWVRSALNARYGLRGFPLHAEGISEDIWAMERTAVMMLGLGLIPKMSTTTGWRVIYHKIRESWSHFAWFSAYPR